MDSGSGKPIPKHNKLHFVFLQKQPQKYHFVVLWSNGFFQHTPPVDNGTKLNSYDIWPLTSKITHKQILMVWNLPTKFEEDWTYSL